MNSLLEALLYGAVQGLTEYLPVSSSAHLLILPKILGKPDPGLAFDVFLHSGTFLATVLYFRRDWYQLFQRSSPLWKWVTIGTIPAVVAALLAQPLIRTVLREPIVTILALSVGGLLLWGIDVWATRKQQRLKEMTDISLKDAAGIGLFQALALIPGMSRSGSTIMGGRFLGYSRESATRISFLLSAPITFAALVHEGKAFFSHPTEWAQADVSVSFLVVGAVSAFVFGWLAIAGLLRLVKTTSFSVFAIYRLLLAAFLWIWIF